MYLAMSLDGFIARPDGDIEWLHRPEYSVNNLQGLSYDEFISTVDALVMGRHTFEKVLSFGVWPYEGTTVVVLSNSGIAIPEHLEGKARVLSGKPEDIVAQLGEEGKAHLYIDGGATVQHFLKAGKINEMTITCIPILLGDGISLFGSIGAEVPLRLIESTSSENGFVQVRYQVG
ncbi:MAG: dihydrofolate reductase family protein [Rhodothermaceae bacterium]|nr:dihydrofolate reductase family protein [Rhodothermaceae bacterium]